jgi:hypothetical protein
MTTVTLTVPYRSRFTSNSGGLDPNGIFATLAVWQRQASRNDLQFAQVPDNELRRVVQYQTGASVDP